jgi:hypothetical protein
MNSQEKNELVISYLSLRNLNGILGIALPVVLVTGSARDCATWQPTISDYFYTSMGDTFVGILCAVAVFLFTYKGYELIDNIATTLAGIFALGTAFFPTLIHADASACSVHVRANEMAGTIHNISASLLFITLALISLLLFTKTKRTEESPSLTLRKKKRNVVYRVCGIIMFACIASAAYFLNTDALSEYHPVFWSEAVALWAFGFSWLTKGESILRDK